MTLRRAVSQDAAACAAILRDWIDQTPWFPSTHPPAADIGFISQKITADEVTVSLHNGEITGFLARDQDYLSCLYVAQTHRRAGIGQRLLQNAQRQTNRLALWTFVANTGAQIFYLRHGFTEAQRTDGADNEEHLPDIEYIWTAKDAP